MNRIYRIIFNRRAGAWQVVPETAKAGRGSSRGLAATAPAWALTAVVAAVMACWPSAGQAQCVAVYNPPTASPGDNIAFSASTGQCFDYYASITATSNPAPLNIGALLAASDVTIHLRGSMSGSADWTLRMRGGPGFRLVLPDAATATGRLTLIPAADSDNPQFRIGAGGNAGFYPGDLDVDAGATLVFDRGDTYTYGGALTGAGTVVKAPGGTFTYTGTANLQGTLRIEGGILQVGDGSGSGSLAAGSVANEGSLVFNNTATPLVSMPISGTGSVTLDAGTLILAGNNTYAGGTQINGGTLHVGNGGTSGSLGSGPVLNHGALVFNRSDNLAVANAIGGTGSLVKDGAGVVTLTGNNTYSGTTQLAQGTLEVSSPANLGTGAIRGQGGYLRFAEDMSLSRNLENGSAMLALGVAPGKTVQLGGSLLIGPGGGLAVGRPGDTGTLVLRPSASGVVLGATPVLAVRAGTLLLDSPAARLLTELADTQVEAGATLDGGGTDLLLMHLQGAGTVRNDGAQTTIRAGDFAGTITGSTSIRKNTAETLVLAGDNTYTGSTLIEGGTLQVGSGAATGSPGTGPVTNNGSLVFNRAGTLTVDGAIGGLGSVTQLGPGTLEFTGANTYTGATQVLGGTLRINGTSAGSDFLVAAGATLGGNGSITGDVGIQAGGRLAAGSSIGTLTIDGNLDLAAGARVEFELGAPGPDPVTPGTGDRLVVTGDVNLGGADFDVHDAGGLGTGLYRLVEYGGSLAGAPGSLTLDGTPSPALSLQYDTANRRINLLSTHGTDIRFWNADGAFGGSGTWANDVPNWSDITGQWTGPMSPVPNFAIFSGAAGTVTVQDTAGPVRAHGLQFASDGWRVEGDAIALEETVTRPAVEVRVGDGTAAGAAFTATIASDLTGTAGLEKTDAGTLVLDGNNTYAGNTVLTAGTLQVRDGNNLGPNRIDARGGRLRVTNDTPLAQGVLVEGNGPFLSVASGAEVRLEGSLTLGNGATFGVGAPGDEGVVVLAPSSLGGTPGNVYDVDVRTGALHVGNARGASVIGNAASVQVAAGATLDGRGLDLAAKRLLGAGTVRSDGATLEVEGGDFAGTLDGSTALHKTGAGTLVLTGPNTYTGGTSVSAGMLQVGDGGTTGSLGTGGVANAGTLVFRRADAVTVGNVITGPGGLVQAGSGVLTLTDHSSYTGPTTVEAGTLLVNGALGYSSVTVMGGATLGGSGRVGSVTLTPGATLAPGSSTGTSIGTLQVDGTLAFDANSVFLVDVDEAGYAADRVSAVTAVLAGTVKVLPGQPAFGDDRRFLLVETQNGVSGTFDKLESSYAFLLAKLEYDANNAYLRLLRPIEPEPEPEPQEQPAPPPPPPPAPVEPPPPAPVPRFRDAANTPNQSAVADALESLGEGHPLFEHILFLPQGAPPGAFDLLSGELHASVQGTLSQVSTETQQQLLGALQASLDAPLQPGAPLAQAGDAPVGASALPQSTALPMWVNLVGGKRRLDGDGNAAGTRQDRVGLYQGRTVDAGGGWRVGWSAGHTGTRVAVDARASSADIASTSLAVGAGRRVTTQALGEVRFIGGVAHTWHHIDSTRRTGGMGLAQTLEAKYRARTADVFGEVSLPGHGATRAEPFAGLAWTHTRQRGFSETGGSAALSAQAQGHSTTSTSLGLRLRHEAGPVTLSASAAWRHTFGDVRGSSTLRFTGSQDFTVAGAPVSRDALLWQLGARWKLARNAHLHLDLQGQAGGSGREWGGRLSLNWGF